MGKEFSSIEILNDGNLLVGAACLDKKISNFLEKKSVFKHIIVKNKLVNLIVKWSL